MKVQIQDNVVYLDDYSIISVVATGSYATCLKAAHPVHGICALLLSDSKSQLQNRLDLYNFLQPNENIQKLFDLQELNIQNDILSNVNSKFNQVFKQTQFVLSGKFYDTSLSSFFKKCSKQIKFDLVRKLIRSLVPLHAKNVFHMDIKPSNVYVENGSVILADFGEAVKTNQQIFTKTQSAYAPVKDVFKGKVLPEKFDVYCLGAIIYEIISGHTPCIGIEALTEQHNRLVGLYGVVAADLLAGALNAKQDQRCNLKYMLNHPFFNETTQPLFELIKYKLINPIICQNKISEDNLQIYRCMHKLRCNDDTNNISNTKIQLSLQNMLKNSVNLNYELNLNATSLIFLIQLQQSPILHPNYECHQTEEIFDRKECFEKQCTSLSFVLTNSNNTSQQTNQISFEDEYKHGISRMDSSFLIQNALVILDDE
ncbi:Kinase [Hexamita inflata]|uniref:Kinase n=1 Tax=Hexamita inflata TaxID=28002 RepID=A0AA86Q5X2_9EUKA|nr:Kinase [Hexamita inflata]